MNNYEYDYAYVVPPAQVQLYRQVRNSEGVDIIPPKLGVFSHREESSSDKGTEDSGVFTPSPGHSYQPINREGLDDDSYDVFTAPTSEERKQIDVRATSITGSALTIGKI